MNELMERMQGLLDEARRQGIAEALQALQDWRDTLTDDLGQHYLDGVDDAVTTVEAM
jgi:hypothetical protein